MVGAEKLKAMPLEISKIRESLESPGKRAKQKKREASNHQARVNLHTEMSANVRHRTQAATDFLLWVRTLIKEGKWQTFASLFRNPTETVALSEQIFEALSRVHDGRDPVYRYEFLSEDAKADWEDYRVKFLNEPNVWREQGNEQMKWGINSIMIVDLPEEQSGTLPEPYFYWLDITEAHDFKEDDGEFEWVTFKTDDGKFAVIDDERWRVFEIDEKNQLGAELVNNAHDLGECPARWFWSTSISAKERHVKRSPISSELSAMDWVLFYLISTKHLDTYAGFPITSGYQPNCNFEHEDEAYGRRYCDGGFLRDGRDNFITSKGGYLERCPKCNDKMLAGAGTFIKVPVPSKENNFTDMRDPVKITVVPSDSLRQVVEELERKWMSVYTRITGVGSDLKNDQAVNEKQVVASFESRRNVLRDLKRNFEEAQKWVDSIVCKLRYGNLFLDCHISYGTEFYLYSEEHLLDWYGKAKAEGAGANVLDLLQDQYFETKFRNNPDMLARMTLIKNIEPFRHLNGEEVEMLRSGGLVSGEDAMFKINFSSLLLRFERENSPITEFGVDLRFDTRVDTIREAMKGYILPVEA